MAGVKATHWAVIGADRRADNSPNWAYLPLSPRDSGVANIWWRKFALVLVGLRRERRASICRQSESVSGRLQLAVESDPVEMAQSGRS